MTRAAFVSRSRVAALSANEQKAQWRQLIERARVQGDWAARGVEIDKLAAATFARLVITGAQTPFPLPHHSAQSAAKAFVDVARAFTTASRPEDREALGRFMAAGAVCLDGLLTAEGHRVAQVWKAQMPKDFD